MAMKETVTVLTQEAFNVLPEYSHSYPSATTIGKQWKAKVIKKEKSFRQPNVYWYLEEYTKHQDPNKVGIKRTMILIRPYGLKVSEICHPDNWAKMWRAEHEANKS